MFRAVAVEVDEAGTIRAIGADAKLPPGKATLIFADVSSEAFDSAALCVKSFADWHNAEEDLAWAFLQTDK